MLPKVEYIQLSISIVWYNVTNDHVTYLFNTI